MLNKVIMSIVLTLAAMSYPVESAAQPFSAVPTKTVSAEFRNVRNIGMGGIGVAEIEDCGTGYYNPAALAWADALLIEGGYYGYIEDVRFFDVSISGYYQPSDGEWEDGPRFGWAASYWAYHFSPDSERTIYMPEGDVSSSILTYYLTASLAAGWKKGIFEFAIGQATSRHEHPPVGRSYWTFDIGLLAAAVLEGTDGSMIRPRLGISVKDLGPGYEGPTGIDVDYVRRYRVGFGFDFAAPQTLEKGFGFNRPVRVFRLSAGVDLLFDDAGDYDWMETDSMSAAGIELTFYELFHLRVGNPENILFGGWTFGTGLELDNGKWLMKADYGLVLGDINIEDWYHDDVSHIKFRLALGMRY